MEGIKLSIRAQRAAGWATRVEKMRIDAESAKAKYVSTSLLRLSGESEEPAQWGSMMDPNALFLDYDDAEAEK